MSKCYEFTIKIVGWGEDLEDAFENAKENFDIERESIPDNEVIDEDLEDE